MKRIQTILAAAFLALTPSFAQGTWDKTLWPKAEQFNENQARDFHWKPGPSNQPIGEARGIFPGRVVMARCPEAARWPGRWDVNEDQWFLDKYTSTDKCDEMLAATLQRLTGTKNNRKAWLQVFRHHNEEIRCLKKRGYQNGEVVAIKINLNNSSAGKRDNQTDATPQMTLAVVRHLVRDAGVPERDIIIYDVKRQIYAQMLECVWHEFPDVRFIQDGEARSEQPLNPKYGDHHGIEAAQWVEGIEYSVDNDKFNEAKLMARQILDATYIVNLALLKLHSYPYNYMEDGDNGQTAITMSAKNHAGSIRGTHEMHRYFNSTEIKKRGKEHDYNPLVDLEASPNLGRKTILYMLDALYCGRKWRTYPLHFPNAPFYNQTEPYANPDWPASLLVSFDPVAIQSVGLDILYAQSLNNTEPGYYDVPRIILRDMADDILREMATPSSTPSGTIYRQQGQPIPSLGVFEHWDSPMTMRYSRNLDPKNGKGIEFIYIPMGSAKEQAASAPYQGLDHLDFFYAGESTKHRMYIVRDGQIAWSYFDPNGRGEISDAVLLSDGHILMAHQHGIREVIPTPGSADGYTVAWQMDTPKGYEIHSIQPIGKDKIVYVQCGDPLTCVVREVPSMKLIREFKLPYRDGGSHGQMRNFRLTRKGTLLLASMQYGAIIEFDSHGQELRRIDMPGAWGVEELKNGNILACSNRGFAREYNKKGKVVWEYDWSKNPAYKDISTQKAHRLPNGNTLMNNWFNEWSSQRIDPENPDVQAIEVTSDGRIVWELSSWFPPADLGPSTTIQPLNEPVNRNKMRFGDIKP